MDHKFASHEQILNQVDRVVQTPLFSRSKILVRFLSYIISETLNGKESSLKEYTIGVDVLNRGFDFNPQSDGIVRIHANRLRKKLREYYHDFGPKDTVKISIPTGGYIPTIEIVENRLNGEHRIYSGGNFVPRQIVAIIPVNKNSDTNASNNFCSFFHNELSSALSWFPELVIVSDFSEAQTDNHLVMDEYLTQLKVDYCIWVDCQIEKSKVKIIVELSTVPKGQPIWTESREFSSIDAKPENTRPIIPKVISVLCGFLGIIYRNKQNEKLLQDYDNLGAIFWHNQYHSDYSQEDIMHALNALDVGLKKNPNNSLLTAFLAELYLNFNLMDIQQGVDFLDKTITMGQRAILLDQSNQHAYGVLAAASVHKKNIKDFEYYYDKCISINPQSPIYQGLLGFMSILAGKYEKGYELMSQAIRQSAYYPFEINVGFCIYSIVKNDYAKALLWAERIKRANLIWDPILRTVCLAQLNRIEDANIIKDEILALSPNFSERARIIVNIPLFDVELQKIIIQGLILSGIDISE